MTIEELAERAGVPVRTVRFYIAERLLPGPGARGREASYGEEHLLRLMLVRRLSERGQRLAKIRAYLEGLSLDEVRALLAEEEHDAAALEAAARAPSPRAYVGELLRRARAAREPAPRVSSSTAGPLPATPPGTVPPAGTPPGAARPPDMPSGAAGPPPRETSPAAGPVPPADPAAGRPAPSPGAPTPAPPPVSPAAGWPAPSPGAAPPAPAPASPAAPVPAPSSPTPAAPPPASPGAGRPAPGLDAPEPAPLWAELRPLARSDQPVPAGSDLWRRLVLAPGVELHVRLDTASLDRHLVQRLLRAAGLPEDALDA